MADTVHIWPDGRDVPLTFYPAPSAQGLAPAMLICPGGAYREHADHEGRGYAAWLNGHGIHCFVLAYRLGSHGHRYPAPFADVARATRVIRHHATRWGVDKNRVGILGSSAGGHLASMLLTRFGEAPTDSTDPIDRASCRPDLGILCYPVISMVKNRIEHRRPT